MKATQQFCLGVLLFCLVFGAASPCRADYTSQTRYVYNKFGNLIALHVVIHIKNVNRIYRFTLDSRFLSLPFATQMTLLDRRYRLGRDAAIISQALSNIEMQLQQQLSGVP